MLFKRYQLCKHLTTKGSKRIIFLKQSHSFHIYTWGLYNEIINHQIMGKTEPQLHISDHQMTRNRLDLNDLLAKDVPLKPLNNSGYFKGYCGGSPQIHSKALLLKTTPIQLITRRSQFIAYLEPLLQTRIHASVRYSAHNQRRNIKTSTGTNPQNYPPTRIVRQGTKVCGTNQPISDLS